MSRQLVRSLTHRRHTKDDGVIAVIDRFDPQDSPGLLAAGIVADANSALAEVPDRTRFAAIGAEKGDAAHDLLRRECLGELLLIAETVLQGQNGCFVANQRPEQLIHPLVAEGFQADQDQVNLTDLSTLSVALHRLQVEVAINRFNREAIAADRFIVASQQEVYIFTCSLQAGSVIQAKGPGADDRNTQSSLHMLERELF